MARLSYPSEIEDTNRPRTCCSPEELLVTLNLKCDTPPSIAKLDGCVHRMLGHSSIRIPEIVGRRVVAARRFNSKAQGNVGA